MNEAYPARRIFPITATLALLLTPIQTEGGRIRVSQESRPRAGDFDENVLGLIDTVHSAGKSAAGFYAYDETHVYAYGGRQLPLGENTSHLFFVDSRKGLSLFIFHDRTNDLDGGGGHPRFYA